MVLWWGERERERLIRNNGPVHFYILFRWHFSAERLNSDYLFFACKDRGPDAAVLVLVKHKLKVAPPREPRYVHSGRLLGSG